MKKIVAVLISSVALVGAAQAAIPGAYVGGGLGESVINTPNPVNNAFTQQYVSHDKGGLGERVFGGYNFNKYVGLEVAYANYARSLYKAYAFDDSTPLAMGTFSVKRTLDALSLVAKGYLPLGESGFNLYALGGMAEVASSVELDYENVPMFPDENKTYYSLRPTYGLGMSYDINSHLTASVEYSHIQGKGDLKTSPSAIPSAELYTLNLAYNFS